MSRADADNVKQLSRNFYLDEFDCSDGTEVPQDLEDGLQLFVAGNLQPLRTFFGSPVTIISGYRTKDFNDRLIRAGHNASENSYHIYDVRGPEGKFAADLIVHGRQPVEVRAAIEGLIRLGLMEEGGIGLYKNFVHYDNGGARRRWVG